MTVDTKMSEEFEDIISTVSSDKDIHALVLFGSRARGESFRDTDMCLFANEVSDRDIKMDYLITFSDKYDIHIFHELPLYVKARVLKDGIVLVMKDFDMLFNIFRATIQEYDLFEPHFKHYLGVDVSG